MAITAENDQRRIRRYSNTQFRFALTYVLITFAVLLFLNYYCARTSQRVIYQSKENALLEKCQITAEELSDLEAINVETLASPAAKLASQRITRLIVTDASGLSIYDSAQQASSYGKYMLFPEIVQALRCNDVFYWNYHDGLIRSRAAVPIVAYGEVIGCVYMLEEDLAQGKVIRSLQYNVLSITVILELIVIFFSFGFSKIFSARMRKILTSIRIIQGGDYSHKVQMGGNDELTALGEEFNDLTDKLQVSENKRRQFVSDASHELRTPLASIKLLSDSILQNPMDTDTTMEFVADIGSEADRLNRMTQKLLSLTKIEPQHEGECEIIYMAPTIQRVVRMLTGLAEEATVSIQMDTSGDSPILILEDDLYQIAFNLVENGIKYNVPGGLLTIRLIRQDENAILQVTDTGVGIPEDALSHIFERFYRVDKARSRKSGGTGLGLSIVRNMVDRNGGKIHVTSQVGKGTCFQVIFPVFDTEVDAL